MVFHYWKSRSHRPETALTISGENRLRARSQYLQLLTRWKTEKCSPNATRTVSEYESLTGIDFTLKTIEERAKLGGQDSWTKFKIAAALPKKALSLIEQFL